MSSIVSNPLGAQRKQESWIIPSIELRSVSKIHSTSNGTCELWRVISLRIQAENMASVIIMKIEKLGWFKEGWFAITNT